MHLTSYQLSCGGVQLKEWPAAKVELYREHTAYHVRRFSYFIDGRLVKESWLTFEKLADARRAFKRQCEIVEST